jgi:hypothetical protein
MTVYIYLQMFNIESFISWNITEIIKIYQEKIFFLTEEIIYIISITQN